MLPQVGYMQALSFTSSEYNDRISKIITRFRFFIHSYFHLLPLHHVIYYLYLHYRKRRNFHIISNKNIFILLLFYITFFYSMRVSEFPYSSFNIKSVSHLLNKQIMTLPNFPFQISAKCVLLIQRNSRSVRGKLIRRDYAALQIEVSELLQFSIFSTSFSLFYFSQFISFLRFFLRIPSRYTIAYISRSSVSLPSASECIMEEMENASILSSNVQKKVKQSPSAGPICQLVALSIFIFIECFFSSFS